MSGVHQIICLLSSRYAIRQIFKKLAWLLVVVICTPTTQARSFLDSDWAEAATKVVRLNPNQFPFLAAPMVSKLEVLGCKIPQHWFSAEPNNLITGEFLKKGQIDVAVLCERGHVTKLLVVPSSSNDKPIILATSTVKNYLQHVGENRIGFSWGIHNVLMRKAILRKNSDCKWQPGLPPNGIDDAFIEKASTTRFRGRHNWLECEGSD
jgi:hypothetical protein